MDNCIECMKNDIWSNGQGHHIISRKKAPYMVHVKMNIAPLCERHHTASPTGIHHNKEMMLRYKQEFQLKLQLLLTKDYYTHSEIKKLLNCSDNTVKAITKTLPISKEGYDRERLIFHMCGDQNYLEVEQ
jgi:hypothetical protein